MTKSTSTNNQVGSSSQSARFKSIQSTLVDRGILKKKSYPTRKTSIHSNTISTNEDACTAVQAILTNKPCDFVLIPYNEFQSSNKCRSNVYNNYHVLCAKNTKHSVGSLVCNFVLTGSCVLEEGTKKFCRAKGTTNLHRHAETHNITSESKVV